MTRRRPVTAEERRLWHLAMQGAEPFSGRLVAAVPPPLPPGPVAEPSLPPAASPSNGTPAALPGRPVKPPAPPLMPGVIHGVDRRTADRLRRGRLDIDGRIDLHGMTQSQAHGVLAGFVHRAWVEGRRCVLVITGKGATSTGGGVLRQAVPRWLAEPALSRMVLAIQPAQPRDGGDGALYVLVKRRRDRSHERP